MTRKRLSALLGSVAALSLASAAAQDDDEGSDGGGSRVPGAVGMQDDTHRQTHVDLRELHAHESRPAARRVGHDRAGMPLGHPAEGEDDRC